MRNQVSAAPKSNFVGDSLPYHDRLPAKLRHALMYANVKWDARCVYWKFEQLIRDGVKRRSAIASLVNEVQQSDIKEIKAFEEIWPSRYGRYPHAAADAAILGHDLIAARLSPKG